MTKKLQRFLDHVFDDDGRVDDTLRASFHGRAVVRFEDGHVLEDRIHIETHHYYTRQALDELIAELLFLKQEWEEHPVFLEQEQAEDMEEIAEEEPEWVEENQPNPFENVANQREEELHRVDFDEMVRQARRFNRKFSFVE